MLPMLTSKMRAGFIGYRNFADKLKALFDESGLVDSSLFFHPRKKIKRIKSTDKFEDMLSCDFIVIASPDWTHGNYLRKLRDYEGYIFCEKIPVLTREDLGFLKENPNSKLYFDFNYRKSLLCELLKEHEERILHIHHCCGYGLALQEEYKDNWRSDLKFAPLGVFQLSGIHFFDLLVFCFGKPTFYHTTTKTVSEYGNSIDNFAINIGFKNRIVADLFFSYTSPYHYNIGIITTEQLIEYDGEALVIKGPRESFDENGRFAAPPLISRERFDFYNDSLKASVDYFLGVVESGQSFPEAESDNNLLSTELFLDILDEVKDRGGS